MSARRNPGGVFSIRNSSKQKALYDPTLLRRCRREIHRQVWWVLVAMHYVGANIPTSESSEGTG